MHINKFDVIVVTPVFEDSIASARLFLELRRVLGSNIFIVAVDDGSVKHPLDVCAIEDASLNGCVIKLRRNVGHQKAISIGLSYISEKINNNQSVIIMDSDGEDSPLSIPILLKNLHLNKFDVIVAARKSRIESIRFKVFYWAYKYFFKAMTGQTINFGNFMALKKAAIRRLVASQDLSIHLAAAVLSAKMRIYVCQIDRGARYAGNSKMNFVGLVLHGFKAMMIFAEDVLVRVGITCALVAALSIFGVFMAVLSKTLGFSTPGWFSIALGILVIIFLQTGALTLITLMLTGVMRNGANIAPISYDQIIDQIIHTSDLTKFE
jgi:glycosyltransferase involved in cell wall biosynthesis